jgi:malate synthase
LEDGRKISIELVRQIIGEELTKVKDSGAVGQFDRAAKIFDDLVANDQFAEFLTLPLYEEF